MNLNPQIIHIFIELLVIAGLTFWFHHRMNKTLIALQEEKDRVARLEKDLESHANAIREQSALLGRHEAILSAIVNSQELRPPRKTLASFTAPVTSIPSFGHTPVPSSGSVSSENKSKLTDEDTLDMILQNELSEIESERSTPVSRLSVETPRFDTPPQVHSIKVEKVEPLSLLQGSTGADPISFTSSPQVEYVFVGTPTNQSELTALQLPQQSVPRASVKKTTRNLDCVKCTEDICLVNTTSSPQIKQHLETVLAASSTILFLPEGSSSRVSSTTQISTKS
jgi:hypothetical protein